MLGLVGVLVVQELELELGLQVLDLDFDLDLPEHLGFLDLGHLEHPSLI